MKSVGEILKQKNLKSDFRNKYEYQAFGNKLAEDLEDTNHRSLYIKMAKKEKRELLEQARDFVMRSEKATTKGRLFMWKFSELKKQAKLDKDDGKANKDEKNETY